MDTDDEGLGGADVHHRYHDDQAVSRVPVWPSKVADSAVDGAAEDDPQFVKQDVNLGAETTMHVREMEADEDDGTVEDRSRGRQHRHRRAHEPSRSPKWRFMDADTPQVLDVTKADGLVPDEDRDLLNALEHRQCGHVEFVARMFPVRYISDTTREYTRDKTDAEPTDG